MKNYFLIIWVIIFFCSCNQDTSNQDPSNQILQDDLILSYDFSGNFNDSSGNEYNGVVYGNVTFTTDRFNSPNMSALFDSTTDSNITSSDECLEELRFKNQSFSVSFWTQIIDNDELQYRGFMMLAPNEWNGLGFEFAKARNGYENGRIYLRLFNSMILSQETGDSIPKNQWLHLVSVVDYQNKKMSLYINNVKDGEISINDFDFSDISYLSFTIGGFASVYYNTGWSGFHNGPLDDFRIYNRAFTVNEIDNLYHEGDYDI